MMKIIGYVILTALVLIGSSSPYAGTQDGVSASSDFEQRYLLLDFQNNSQHLTASVGQQIEITLGSVGPGGYGDPVISSAAVRLASTALRWPPNPGGSVLIYIFEAAAEGEARVQFPFTSPNNPELAKQRTFTVTIQVMESRNGPTTLSEVMRPDQANAAPWKNAWTRLYNNVVQETFVPSRPRLTGVEVELVAAKPGAQDGDVSMSVANSEGQTLAVESKHVPVSECDHVIFVFPHGGLRLSPGEVYRIGVSSAVFGWKYVDGGYAAGAALLNDKTLSVGTRNTFLFKTFSTAVTMADPMDPVLGTWILNVAKSKFNLGSAPKREKRTYEAMPEGIKETIESMGIGGGFIVTSPAYKMDGKTYALNPLPGLYDVDAHEVMRVSSREYRVTLLRDGQIVAHDVIVVSKDGLVMTMTTTSTTASGRSQRDVRVFDRQ